MSRVFVLSFGAVHLGGEVVGARAEELFGGTDGDAARSGVGLVNRDRDVDIRRDGRSRGGSQAGVVAAGLVRLGEGYGLLAQGNRRGVVGVDGHGAGLGALGGVLAAGKTDRERDDDALCELLGEGLGDLGLAFGDL